jgi:hypothetical protein
VSGADENAPIRTRALVVDPVSMIVLWANEAAHGAAAAGAHAGAPVDTAVPMAAELGVTDAITRVAATGEPHYARADLIPTRRGSMVRAISLDRLPNGQVLVLMEDVWHHAGKREPGSSGRTRAR